MHPRALGLRWLSTASIAPPLLRSIVLSILLSILLVGCKAEPPRAQSVLLDRGVPKSDDAVLLDGVTMHRFDGDRVVLVGQMRTAWIDRERGRADGQDVLVTTRDAEGAAKTSVAAPSGHADFVARTLRLEGGVRARDREGRVLTTETLDYAGETDEIHAPGPVVIEGQNFRATGASMRGRSGDGHIEVEGPITAHVAPSPPSPR